MSTLGASRIITLARQITEGTSAIDSYLKKNNLPEPSFEENGPIDLNLKDPKIASASLEVEAAAIELSELLAGPSRLTQNWCISSSLHAIYKFKLPSKVPLNGSISYEELAENCGLHTIDVRRLVRYAIVWHRIFLENQPGRVSHSAASKLLRDNPDEMASVGFITEELVPGFVNTAKAMTNFRNFEREGTGWSLGMGTDQAIYQYYNSHPELAKRFGQAMKAYTKNQGQDPISLARGYDWKSLGNSTLVDCGGGNAHVAVVLAKNFPELKIVVQDLPSQIQAAQIPEELSDRIQVTAHDFFKTQPVQADIYLFRIIFHNWSDPLAIKILHALIPALKPGARVIFNDVIAEPPGTLPLVEERFSRAIDSIMLTVQNAYEREEADWRRLFKKADARFSEPWFTRLESSTNGIVEVTWKG